ncbi:hypothetical protein C5167_027930 [Papaver somniferum]|nr:hypothetical protein C5167_027930 [Papaver somniferum]
MLYSFSNVVGIIYTILGFFGKTYAKNKDYGLPQSDYWIPYPLTPNKRNYPILKKRRWVCDNSFPR